MKVQDVMKLIKENEVRFVDLRFTDTHGKEHHIGLPLSAFEEEHFQQGQPFDGSSMAAWKGRLPIARWRSMFSISTMASSTRMPMTRVSASRLMPLSV